MVQNYFKLGWRNILNTRSYSTINILGLSIGLTSFIVILLYLNFELSYDKWDPSLKKVYKISERSDDFTSTSTPAPLGSFLKQKLPEIEASTSFQPAGDFECLLSTDNKKIYQKGGIQADSSFLRVFSYHVVNGNASLSLDKPNAILISRELSNKLFGDNDPVGKTIKIYNAFENEVTGIFEQPLSPSHLDVQFIYRSPYEKQNRNWENYSNQTYVKTKKIMPVDKLEQNINKVYYDERIKKNNLSFEAFKKAGHQQGLFLDPVESLYNFPKFGHSNLPTISVLLILATLLLIAGAINFSNLSIAVSIRRAREVGVRKVLGASRKELFWQFMSEIAMQCFISLIIAIILINIILPYFNNEFNIHISFFQAGNALSIGLQVVACLLLVIILSGLYPSVFLTYFNTAKVLKGNYSRGRTGMNFRNGLILVQFIVAAFFIMGVLVMSQQMNFMQTKDKGFSGSQVIRVESTQKTRDFDFELVKNKLLAISGVESVSKTTTVPGDKISDTSTIPFKYKEMEYRMSSVKISDDYFKTLHISLVQGRLFNNSYNDEHTRAAIINEAAAKKMNISNPIGSIINFPRCDSVPVEIVGVVKDFHILGFESIVKPVVYTVGNNACRFQSGGAVLIKIAGDHMNQTIASIENVWKGTEPEFPIRYTFIDDNFKKLFDNYIRLQKLISFFAFTAILISLIGLFALTTLLIGQRTKEIGIRKVLGAGFGDMVLLLNKNFISLILLAVIIALPIAGWVCNKWLETFAYRINLSWWYFSLAALIIITISIFTITIQTFRITIANPVKSLRSE